MKFEISPTLIILFLAWLGFRTLPPQQRGKLVHVATTAWQYWQHVNEDAA